MGKIIMTGVDGNLGGHALETIIPLVDKGDLILTTPNAEAVERFKAQGYDARIANYLDPEQLKEAFAGGETMFLVSLPQVGKKRRVMHTNALIAARDAGVERVVYTSQTGAQMLENAGYEIADHRYTEWLIMALGFKYVFLRNSQYAEAMIAAVETAAKGPGVIRNNMGEGLMAHVARRDCAEAAAYATAGLAQGKYVDEAFFISGPKLRTISEFIALVAPAFGAEVRYEYVTDEENFAEFDAMGVPRETDGEWLTEAAKNSPFCSQGMVTYGTAIRLGQMASCTDDFTKLTGKPSTTLEEMVANIGDFGIGARHATDE